MHECCKIATTYDTKMQKQKSRIQCSNVYNNKIRLADDFTLSFCFIRNETKNYRRYMITLFILNVCF